MDAGKLEVYRFINYGCFIWILPSKNWAHIYNTSSNPKLNTKNFKRFAVDSHARFDNTEQPLQFLDILNSQDASIQYTIEFENENKQLSLIDITITNTRNNSYDFKIFQKTLMTNIQIKPDSNIAPHIAMRVFKVFFYENTKHVLRSIYRVK